MRKGLNINHHQLHITYKFFHDFKIPKEHCKQVPKQVEKHVPRTKCKNVPVTKCQDIPINVPREECREFPKTICTQDPINVGKKIPKKECKQIPIQKCIKIPGQVNKEVPKSISKKVCFSTKPKNLGYFDSMSSYKSSELGYRAPAQRLRKHFSVNLLAKVMRDKYFRKKPLVF